MMKVGLSKWLQARAENRSLPVGEVLEAREVFTVNCPHCDLSQPFENPLTLVYVARIRYDGTHGGQRYSCRILFFGIETDVIMISCACVCIGIPRLPLDLTTNLWEDEYRPLPPLNNRLHGKTHEG